MTISPDPTFRPAYVLDTHALVWYLTADHKLSPRASVIFEAAEQGHTQLIISAIVIAELFFANAKWNLFADFNALFADLRTRPYFQFVDFTPADVLDFARDQAVPEMYDRIITGLARRLGMPWLTRDPQITAAGHVEVIW